MPARFSGPFSQDRITVLPSFFKRALAHVQHPDIWGFFLSFAVHKVGWQYIRK